MIHFILITKIQTSINAGKPSINMFRRIEKLEDAHSFISHATLVVTEELGLVVDITVNIHDRENHPMASTTPMTIGENQVSFNFTEFTERELPFYAKHLSWDEVEEFIEYSKSINLHFEE